MKVGANDISKLYVGATEVSKAYVGSTEVWSSVLPSGYTRKSYIYNATTAWLDTGVALGNTDEVYFSYVKISPLAGDHAIWGARDTSSMHCWVNGYGANVALFVRWGGKALNVSSSSDIKYVEIKNNIVYYYWANDYIDVKDTNAGTFQMVTPVALFAQRDTVTNTVRYPCTGVGLTAFEIKNKFNGIPCLDPNGVAGMYDTVNGVFHSSANSESLIAG